MEVPLPFPRTAERVACYREGGFPQVSGQHQEYLRLTEKYLRPVRRAGAGEYFRTDV